MCLSKWRVGGGLWSLALRILLALFLPISHAAVPGSGALQREVYLGIGGNSVADLTSAPQYPDFPDFRTSVTGGFEAPTDVFDNYGQRLRGWIIPPVSGEYTFWIASDDASELWLSPDDDFAHVVKIAEVQGWTTPRQWEVEAGQRSNPVSLEANRQYAVLALHKEGGGGDNLAVRWLRPDGPDEAPIPAEHLLPVGVSRSGPIVAKSPVDTTAGNGSYARFAVELGNFDPCRFQWLRDGTEIPGATFAELFLGPLTFADSGAKFRCVVTSDFGMATSDEAVLTVTWPGGILREVYTGIGGVSVADLTLSGKYPDRPDFVNVVTDLFEAPTDVLDNYGQRLSGWIVAPETGDYTFWIASDDGSELWLSSDEDPANLTLIATVFGWTSWRQWEIEANQRSQPVALEKGRRYAVRALQKEGGGGDNLAVRWLRPNGVDEAPISAHHLLPTGTSFTGPQIASQPSSLVIVEREDATFRIVAGNTDPTEYQWQRDGADLPGATSRELTVTAVPLADSGATFRCRLTSQFGIALSDAATLTVTADVVPPTIVALGNLAPDLVRVVFSEPIDASTAINPVLYDLGSDVSVLGAGMSADDRTVLLTTSPLTLGNTYRLTVTGVTDRAATPNEVAPGTSATFLALAYVPVAIGDGGLPASITPPLGSEFDVLGGGGGIGTTSGHDEFQFFYQQRSGDFDVRVRVATAQVTDPSFLAGIMARETLTAESRFAAVFASSPQLGTLFQARDFPGGFVNRLGGVPVNYPQTWLRLRRGGDLFEGFASFDGQSWIRLGASVIPLPPALYFGMAVASRDPSHPTAVQFRDLGESVNPQEIAAPDFGESPGPSSPFTGLVFSELHYHPAPRADGRDLEFVEIYNAGDVFEDLSGMKLSGDIDYVFPAGTSLQAGTFLVVARSPADLVAVHGSLANVLGPYTGSLPDGQGQLRLRNELGGIMLEVNYADGTPWPVAAGGGGPSLILVRPSYGEDDPRAWSTSSRVDGSPGRMETREVDPYAGVVLNEFLVQATNSGAPFLEFYNHGSAAVDLSGARLGSAPAAYPTVIPPGSVVAPGGFLSLDLAALGWVLDPSGGWLFLVNPGQTRVIDAVRYEGQQPGVASGRFPNGAAAIRRLNRPTPGTANAAPRPSAVVVNELMYNPLSNNSNDEYVELHNPSASDPVDVSGWRLLDGITYTLPANTRIAPGGYLVVARSKSRLLANYPQLGAANLVGNFSGSLRNSGERIALAFPASADAPDGAGGTVRKDYFVVENEVTYGDGGRWAEDADGGGSSLELKDPRADTRQASSWAASDETSRADWTTLEVTGVLDLGNDSFSPNQLQVTIQGAGECVLDDLEVRRVGGPNLVGHGDLETADGSWSFQGNHSRSAIEPGVGFGGGQGLHLRTTGRGDTGANRTFVALTEELFPGETVTIRARARWLRGWPEVLLRLRGSWLELGGRMTVPLGLGTPGQANSRAVANLGPSIDDLAQTPILPAGGQPVVLSARVTDPEGVAGVELQYRRDPDPTVFTTPLNDDGQNGDAVAGDGIFTTTLPGEFDGTLVAWRLVATDAATSPATSAYPDFGYSPESLIRWGEPVPQGTFGNYHFWMTQADFEAWRAGGGLNNTPRPVTLVYGRHRIVHGASVRDKGSPFHGGVGDFVFDLPKDGMLLGENDLLLAAPGNQGSDDAKQREQIAFWILRKLGAPYLHRRFVTAFLNGSRQYEVMEQAQEPNGSIAEAWFSEGGSGDLYKIEDWFEFSDEVGFFSNRDATLERFTTTGDVLKAARYRWSWRKRAVEGSANDFANLFDLVNAVNAPPESYVAGVEALVDVDEWMRVFALQRIVGNWDSYGFGRGKNSYLYKRETGPNRLFAWDIDFVLGSGSNGPTDGLWGANDPTINRMYDTPAFRRLLWAAYREAVDGPLRQRNVGPQMAARYAALLANDLNPSDPQAIQAYIDERREFIRSQLDAVEAATFAITSNGGNDFSTEDKNVTLTGTAPFSVRTLKVNGTGIPLVWLNDQEWQATVPLTQPVNVLNFAGFDHLGNLVPGASDSITVTTTDAQPLPGKGLILTEILYQPLPAGSDGNLYEFLELYNAGTRALNLAGASFTAGIAYTFPPGTVLDPGKFFVVARDAAKFAERHPGVVANGVYSGQLDNGGETLTLSSAGGDPIISFAYDDVPPWPTSPDGTGPSLQRLNLAPDSSNGPENWAAGAATPGNFFLYEGGVLAGSDAFERLPGEPLKIAVAQLLANDSSGAGRLAVNGVSERSAFGATITRSGPWIYYTPGATDLTDSFTYLVTNGVGGSARALVTITVKSNEPTQPNILGVEPLPGGPVRVRSLGMPGFTYRVRATTDLTPPVSWVEIGTAVADATGQVSFIDPDAGGYPQRFYQLVGP